MSGDVPFKESEILAFCQESLTWLWTIIYQPLKTAEQSETVEQSVSPASLKQAKTIEQIVAQEKLVDIEEVLKKIVPPISEEILRQTCAQLPIKIHTTPTRVCLQWLSTSPSAN